jgi:hypothetical protein
MREPTGSFLGERIVHPAHEKDGIGMVLHDSE